MQTECYASSSSSQYLCEAGGPVDLNVAVCLPVCPSACLSVRLLVCLPALSACLSVCLSVCVPVCLSVCLSTCLSVCLFTGLVQACFFYIAGILHGWAVLCCAWPSIGGCQQDLHEHDHDDDHQQHWWSSCMCNGCRLFGMSWRSA